jgi:hypothetical protein
MGLGLRMRGKRIPQKARDRRVCGAWGCMANGLIDFPVFCAIMDIDLSRPCGVGILVVSGPCGDGGESVS